MVSFARVVLLAVAAVGAGAASPPAHAYWNGGYDGYAPRPYYAYGPRPYYVAPPYYPPYYRPRVVYVPPPVYIAPPITPVYLAPRIALHRAVRHARPVAPAGGPAVCVAPSPAAMPGGIQPASLARPPPPIVPPTIMTPQAILPTLVAPLLVAPQLIAPLLVAPQLVAPPMLAPRTSAPVGPPANNVYPPERATD